MCSKVHAMLTLHRSARSAVRRTICLQFLLRKCSMLFQSCWQQELCLRINALHLGSMQDLLPPKDPEVQVRALQDYGEMAASNGTIHFQRNAVFFMAQEDAEPLIRQRVLERLDMADLH